jgi:hypothetical protein
LTSITKIRAKGLAALVFVAALGMLSGAPAKAQSTGVAAYARNSRKADKNAANAQRKAMKKFAKAQRKSAKKANRHAKANYRRHVS